MGKAKGIHLQYKLSALFVRSTSKAGFYGDGNGLYLKIDKSGAKRWIQRITITGKRCDLGLGSVTVVSLKEARDAALENRRIVNKDGDPLADKRKDSVILTFEEAAREVYRINLPTWSSGKQTQQWINSMTAYVFDIIGRKKVSQIDSSDLLKVLTPIWTEKHETARRVKQRIGVVLEWAIAQGWREDNPADSIKSALPKVKKVVKHHKSLPYQDVSNAIKMIKNSNASLPTKLALEMLILTATRSGEIRNAKWDEINLDKALWTVPIERMKAKKEHRVPLSPRCLEILNEADKLKSESDFIFSNLNTGKPLSDATLSKLVRELKIKCVPHGFRSSFRMWTVEETEFPNEICEFALAHVVGNEAERAYQRSDLLERRREMMNMWAKYLV